MRISDWSSDVCSSDLTICAPVDRRAPAVEVDHQPPAAQIVAALAQFDIADPRHQPPVKVIDRAEERRVGKECVSTCRSRWSLYLQQKKQMTVLMQIQYDQRITTIPNRSFS